MPPPQAVGSEAPRPGGRSPSPASPSLYYEATTLPKLLYPPLLLVKELGVGLIMTGGQRSPWFLRSFGRVSRRSSPDEQTVRSSWWVSEGSEARPYGRSPRSGDRGVHRLHVGFPAGPEPLGQHALVQQHPLARDDPGASLAGLPDQRGLPAGTIDRVADRPAVSQILARYGQRVPILHPQGRGVHDDLRLAGGLAERVARVHFDLLQPRPAQLVPQLYSVLHAPVDNAQLPYAHLAESEGNGSRRAPGAKEQDRLAGQIYPGLLAGHDHPAPVGVIAAQPGVFYHHGIHGAGDPGSFIHVVEKREHRPFVGHCDVEAPEVEGFESGHGGGEVLRLHVEGDVEVVQILGCERGVVHLGAQAVPDGVPDQGQQTCFCADHPSTSSPGCPSSSMRHYRGRAGSYLASWRQPSRLPAPPCHDEAQRLPRSTQNARVAATTSATASRACRANSTGVRVSRSDRTGASALTGIPSGSAARNCASGSPPSLGSRRMARLSSCRSVPSVDCPRGSLRGRGSLVGGVSGASQSCT